METLQKSDYFCMDVFYVHEPASDENQCKVGSDFLLSTDSEYWQHLRSSDVTYEKLRKPSTLS